MSLASMQKNYHLFDDTILQCVLENGSLTLSEAGRLLFWTNKQMGTRCQSDDSWWRRLCALHWRSVDQAAHIIDTVLQGSLTAQQCFAILITREPPSAGASEEENDGRGPLVLPHPADDDSSTNDRIIIAPSMYTPSDYALLIQIWGRRNATNGSAGELLLAHAVREEMAQYLGPNGKAEIDFSRAGIAFESNIDEVEEMGHDNSRFEVRSEDFVVRLTLLHLAAENSKFLDLYVCRKHYDWIQLDIQNEHWITENVGHDLHSTEEFPNRRAHPRIATERGFFEADAKLEFQVWPQVSPNFPTDDESVIDASSFSQHKLLLTGLSLEEEIYENDEDGTAGGWEFQNMRSVPLFREAWPEGVCLLHILEGMDGWISV